MKKHEGTRKATKVIEESDVQREELTPEEERILRMRAGAKAEKGMRLGSKLDGVKPEHRGEVTFRLALMEAEILAALEADPDLRTDRKRRIIEALRDAEEEATE